MPGAHSRQLPLASPVMARWRKRVKRSLTYAHATPVPLSVIARSVPEARDVAIPDSPGARCILLRGGVRS